MAFHPIADLTGEGHTSIGMDKELNGLAKFSTDLFGECIYLPVRFMHIEEPWEREVTIDVEFGPISDHAEIVQVDPSAWPIAI